jgi:hypothetical protein
MVDEQLTHNRLKEILEVLVQLEAYSYSGECSHNYELIQHCAPHIHRSHNSLAAKYPSRNTNGFHGINS